MEEKQKITKEERKQYVKEQRKKFFASPGKFIKEEMYEPTIEYWKKHTLHAIWTFLSAVIITYIIFGMLQAVLLDTVYCDSNIDKYDGKILYKYNNFVKNYNKELIAFQNSQIMPTDLQEREQIAQEFFNKYTINCTHNFKRWNEERYYERLKSSAIGFLIVVSKNHFNPEQSNEESMITNNKTQEINNFTLKEVVIQ